MLSSLDLSGRVVVVIGGTSGLGHAIAPGLSDASRYITGQPIVVDGGFLASGVNS